MSATGGTESNMEEILYNHYEVLIIQIYMKKNFQATERFTGNVW